MKKLTILVDMDDTIENLLSCWVEYLNHKYGLRVKTDDVRDWDLSIAYPSLTNEQVYAPLYDDRLWHNVKPLPYAVFLLKRLKEKGHEIYIVTSSNYQTLKTKMDAVLFRYFDFIDWNHVIITNNKKMIRGDVLIDDAPQNLVGGEYQKILVNSPHNRAFDAKANGIKRANSWLDVYRYVHEMESEPKL